jgi:hypothetical protein
MKLITILLFAALLGICSVLKADSPADPEPIVFTAFESSKRDVFVAMTPPEWDFKAERYTHKGFATAYRLTQAGKFLELYRISDVYSFEAFLSEDADLLVLMGPWCEGQEPKATDLAVAFYKGGKLLKQYSTADLVKKPDKVQASVSHYNWRADHDINAKGDISHLRPKLDGRAFTLSTIDGLTYKFDATTGIVVYSHPFKTD